MERLTQTSDSGGVAFTFDLDITCRPSEAKKILNLATKLKEYEDLEEQDRLVKLPCKVGDVLYRVNKGAKEPVIMMRVLQLYIKQLHKDRTVIKIIAINDDDMGESCYFLEDIGKTVFLTKSKAEARLKELRGSNEQKKSNT